MSREDLLAGGVVLLFAEQAGREIRGEADDLQVMPLDVVQVRREAQPLVRDGQVRGTALSGLQL